MIPSAEYWPTSSPSTATRRRITRATPPLCTTASFSTTGTARHSPRWSTMQGSDPCGDPVPREPHRLELLGARGVLVGAVGHAERNDAHVDGGRLDERGNGRAEAVHHHAVFDGHEQLVLVRQRVEDLAIDGL